MDALAAWLKQIILVVLLATFIDLLLPNRTMQRYVKLVVSLFILVTILSPVMSLIGSNANMRMLAATLEGWDVSGIPKEAVNEPWGEPGDQAPLTESMPALSEVMSVGEAIQEKQQAKSLELLADKLESMVKEQIESQHDVAVIRSDAELAFDKDRFPVIEQLTVVIGANSPSSEQGADEIPSDTWGMEPVESIEPVQPVDIRLGVGQQAKEQEDLPAITGSREAQILKREITESLALQWNVDERRIMVLSQNAATEARN